MKISLDVEHRRDLT